MPGDAGRFAAAPGLAWGRVWRKMGGEGEGDMAMIGHNGGPTMEGGEAWRRHCWAAARAEKLPTVPLEVVRMRVRRAQDLGLDYRTYASVRAASGHDVLTFLFSSNALRATALRPAMPAARADKLAVLAGVERLGLAVAPLAPGLLAAANPAALDESHPAPAHLAPWARARAELRALLGRRAGQGVVLVGDMPLEAEWVVAARLGAFLPADRFFGAAG